MKFNKIILAFFRCIRYNFNWIHGFFQNHGGCLNMQIITEPKDSIAKLWGHPKGIESKQYRLMKYILRNECDDGTLLYNVVTSEMLLIPKGEFDIALFPAVYSPAMDELINKHFLVPVDFDEKKSVDQLRTIIRKLEKKGPITGYTILPTTCCNARCFYCYENDFPKQTMTIETANNVVDFIIKNSGNSGINICWFGGEPLVGKNIIDHISSLLYQKGKEFAATMVSNAYLFSEEVVETAVNLWHLKNVQITLDGTQDVYNQVKAYQGISDNPYQVVLRNIRLLLEAEISVSVRLNVTEDNLNNLYLLVNELYELFKGMHRLSIYTHTVYGNVGYDPVYYSLGEEEQLSDKAIELDAIIEEKGFYSKYKHLPSFSPTHCMADNDQSIIIYPDGKLGKCENSSPNDSVGDIFTGLNIDTCSLCKTYLSMDSCVECPVYPYCLRLQICPEKKICSVKKKTIIIQKYQKLLVERYTYKNKPSRNPVFDVDICTD